MSTYVAYFSAEFGLNENLPIYSGGLGILAGDHIKAAADLNLPLIGVGLLYSKGYFQQHIREDGVQEHLYPELAWSEMPIDPVLNEEGHPLLVEIPIASRRVKLRAWQAQVGHVAVYLLNSDVESNSEYDRRLTDNLYPSEPDRRLCQEIILGLGGARLLQALGIEPAVWHMNEGHSAFLAFERIRQLSASGVPFETALEAVKASTVFTTHTPVPAGHDVFAIDMIDYYLGDFYWQMGADRGRILELGRVGDVFNMTRLAVSTSARVNGVSKLHGEVTQRLFHAWKPHIPKEDIAVDAITNGVHAATWISPVMKKLFERHFAPDWEVRAAEQETWQPIRDIPAAELWDSRLEAKERMIEELRLPAEHIRGHLVIGFARRFATYKRALLIFQDLDRLDRIVNHPERPVCFVFAGKAHPADNPGQELIRQLVALSRDERFRHRIFVVENYDKRIAKPLVQGVDVWLNTPQKPLEASGTSGQKAALNGVLNCSVLDGWWAEGYDSRNGWAIEGATDDDPDTNARIDGEELYRLLEEEIAPLYYQRDGRNIPTGWVDRVRACIRTLAPQFNTQRMVRDYWNELYVPTAGRGKLFAAENCEIAGRIAAFKRSILEQWHQVRVHGLNIQSAQSTRIGLADTHFQVRVELGPICHRDVSVEVVGSDRNGGIWRKRLSVAKELGDGVYQFEGTAVDSLDYMQLSTANARVTPVHPDFANEFEMELAAWG